MILLIDNYDSFAHNLARYLRQLGQQVRVVRNDVLSVEEIANEKPAAIVMSPGPCTPVEAGICLQAVRQLHSSIPMLGVCLGHQAICQAFGARVIRASPVHGQATAVEHYQHPLFQKIESPFMAGRYHSLIADCPSLPSELEVIATTSRSGVVMAIAHRRFPVFGVQFHPESVLTESGYRLLGNFLGLAGIDYNRQIAALESTIWQTSPAVEKSAERPWPALRPHQYQLKQNDP
jgi:anthranilate synthase/aminodeoxychorismate synthase-like glutamine amidotransferase